MNNSKIIFLILFLVFFVNYFIFAWSEPAQDMPSSILTPINTSSTAQIKAGSLTVGELIVNGSSNICQAVAFNDSGVQEKCPTGYYVTEMVASVASGYMLCCKVSNPLN